ncbi:MAG TPA: HEAT repeat domain-containing protein [Candidatus Dormibacteraeota bacterium]|nr:HEAT repeat domain-containing protein [Candidatus Dormibacteraeota bacterium]
MPGKKDEYRRELQSRSDWDSFLHAHSGLPGPRANLELVEVAGDLAPAETLWQWSASGDEFLALCGAAGLGRFAIEDSRVLPRLLELASNPRWRVREGVAIALQRMGKRDMARLIKEMETLAGGSAYVQRAAAAGLCEPPLLKDPKQVKRVLAILNRITRSLAATKDRKSEEFRVLRTALGYCWSVAAAASPADGKAALEPWLSSRDPDVRWIMKSNLGKSRMSALGARWVAASLKRLG